MNNTVKTMFVETATPWCREWTALTKVRMKQGLWAATIVHNEGLLSPPSKIQLV